MTLLRLVPVLAVLIASPLRAAEWLPIEQEVAKATESPRVTVVHFWASWCPNCRAELVGGGWKQFIEANPEVEFLFITVRDEKPGAAELAKHGLGSQKNFRHLQHPNASRRKEDEMTSFMGMRVGWIPTTWVFQNGRQRYALNYGQIRFPILQQLVEDATPKK
jgi:thiol-disulfide isomerase/thioredoxin